MTTQKQLIQKWQEKIKESQNDGQMLFAVQAHSNYILIKNNTPKKALEKLKEQYKKYGDMGIAMFIKEGIDDLEELLKK
jgi:hypothetical protein